MDNDVLRFVVAFDAACRIEDRGEAGLVAVWKLHDDVARRALLDARRQLPPADRVRSVAIYQGVTEPTDADLERWRRGGVDVDGPDGLALQAWFLSRPRAERLETSDGAYRLVAP